MVFLILAQKKLIKDKMTIDEHNYYLGMYNTLPAFLFCIIQKNFGFGNIKYILYAISNGIFLFYLSSYLQNEAFQYISISKFIIIFLTSTVFYFVLGFVLLGEIIYITDIIDAGLITSFLLYNVYYPPSI